MLKKMVLMQHERNRLPNPCVIIRVNISNVYCAAYFENDFLSLHLSQSLFCKSVIILLVFRH